MINGEQIKTRIEYVDEIKGFAILLVVLGHVAERYLVFDIYSDSAVFFELVYKVIYSFHMPLMMVVSGFLFSLAYLDPCGAKTKRLAGHWLDYFIVFTVMSLIAYVFKMIFAKDVLVPIAWSRIFTIWLQPIGYLWYLHLLLVLYLINIALRRFFHHYLGLLVLFFVLCCICTYMASPAWTFDFISKLFRYEFYFFLGIVLNKRPSICIFQTWFVFSVFVVAIILEIYALKQDVRPDKQHIIHVFIAYGFSMAIISFSKVKFELELKKIFRLFGRLSFEIYLFHQYPLTTFKILLPRIRELNGMVSLFLNFTLSIIAVCAVFSILEKHGLKKYIIKPYSSIRNRILDYGKYDVSA